MKRMRAYIALLRIRHWAKNLLVFFPLAFSGLFFQPVMLAQGFAACAAFCLAASSVYIVNDIRDLEADRGHPRKRNRPLAQRAISVSAAIVVSIVCLAGAFGIIVALRGLFWSAIGCLGCYVVLNVGYSFGMKNIPIADIAILSSGFLLRVLFGGIFCDIPVSSWMFLAILSLSFFFAFGKRRGELVRYGSNLRKSLEAYPVSFLDKNMYVFLGLSICFYSLWTFERIGDFSTTLTPESATFVIGIPLMMLVCLRYSMDVESSGCDGDPVEVIASDRSLLIYILVWAIDMLLSLYGGGFIEAL